MTLHRNPIRVTVRKGTRLEYGSKTDPKTTFLIDKEIEQHNFGITPKVDKKYF